MLDVCHYGSQDKYNVKFNNSLPYPIDVMYISQDNDEEKEIMYRHHLEPGKHLEPKKFIINTHFAKFTWIFKQSGTNIRIFAKANGMKEDFFEACYFKVKPDSEIIVTIVGPGEFK